MELNTGGIIGQSSSLKDVFRILAKVAPTDSTVLVTGESGTGKELLVRALHMNSQRAEKPFVPINCGLSPKSCWSQNFSVTKKVPSPMLYVPAPAASKLLTAAPYFWMK